MSIGQDTIRQAVFFFVVFVVAFLWIKLAILGLKEAVKLKQYPIPARIFACTVFVFFETVILLIIVFIARWIILG